MIPNTNSADVATSSTSLLIETGNNASSSASNTDLITRQCQEPIMCMACIGGIALEAWTNVEWPPLPPRCPSCRIAFTAPSCIYFTPSVSDPSLPDFLARPYAIADHNDVTHDDFDRLEIPLSSVSIEYDQSFPSFSSIASRVKQRRATFRK
jgi:hypothetical protein